MAARDTHAEKKLGQGTLLAIFAGKPAPVRDEMDREVMTAIFKQPVTGPVMVRRLNLDGDQQADLKVHGGVDKAVYCYPAEHYEAWQRELARDLDYGTFGENLTVTGLLEDALHLNDVIVLGDAVLQVSEPRYPCYKLGIKMEDPLILKPFQQSGRSGFYCRVLQEGEIQPGASIQVIERDPGQPTVAEVVARVNRQDGD